MGRVVDHFGIDWWDVISLVLQPELQDVRLALRLAEKLKGCRTLVGEPTVADGGSFATVSWEYRCTCFRVELRKSPVMRSVAAARRRGGEPEL
jgi:hypothetical protein